MSDETKVLVPDIGDFDEVDVIELLVEVGSMVAVEDPLVTLESDKVIFKRLLNPVSVKLTPRSLKTYISITEPITPACQNRTIVRWFSLGSLRRPADDANLPSYLDVLSVPATVVVSVD